MSAILPSSSTRSTIRQLRADVEAICFPRGRMVGSPGHKKARKVLCARLEEVGCVPFRGESFELPYQKNGTLFCNLIGVIRGSNPRLAPLLVGAHYDSAIAAPCADDNAAAVAIALGTAEHFAADGELERDLIVAIFDAEEMPYFTTGCMGSQRFYAEQRGDRPIHAAIIMDLVGHDVSIHSSMLGMVPQVGGLLRKLPGLADRDIPLPVLHPLLFITGTESHPDLQNVITDAGWAIGLKLVPTLNRYVGDMSDHGIFRENGVPYFFLSCGRWTHYHQPSDTPDRLNYRKMEAITRQVCQLLKALDSRPLHRSGGRERVCDTLDLEIRSMRRSFGPLWPLLLKRAGLANIGNRADMDQLVDSILALGL
jgi:hypothetical protein